MWIFSLNSSTETPKSTSFQSENWLDFFGNFCGIFLEFFAKKPSYFFHFSYSYPCKALGQKYELEKYVNDKQPGEVTVHDTSASDGGEPLNELEKYGPDSNGKLFQPDQKTAFSPVPPRQTAMQKAASVHRSQSLHRTTSLVSSKETQDATAFLEALAKDAEQSLDQTMGEFNHLQGITMYRAEVSNSNF